jgi:lipopolysaccharide assembly outer membrane protein LptD (OstA)
VPRSPLSHIAPLLLAAALAAGPASAQGGFLGEGAEKEQPFDITADSVEHDAQRGVYVARGNVRITQPDRVLSADWVGFSATTRQGLASGNVVVIEGEDVLRAEVLQFQIDTVKGVVFHGSLEGSGTRFLMSGDTIQKTGENSYVFDRGRFTSCKCPEGEKEPWVLTAKSADLDIGGYGTARNTAFEVLGVPVVWLPWMIYPLKSDRATGFLFPVWNASSRNGFDIGLPFFWAVGERLNLTFTASYLTENGFLPSVEGEYVFGERSSGRFYGAFIDDDDIDENDPSSPFSSKRWAVEAVHNHYLPYDFRWVVDARFFSDNRYPFDFKEFSTYRKDRFIESQTFVEKRFGPLDRYGFFGGIQWADDNQNPDDQDRDEFLVQRMPQLHASGVPQRLDRVLPGLVGSFDADYTHYWAQDQVSDPFNEARLVDDLFVDAGLDAIPDGAERDTEGRTFHPDGTVTLDDGRTLPVEDYLVESPNAAAVLRDGTVTTVAEVLASDPMALLDGSLDNFPPGAEGDRVFQEGELLHDRGHRVLLNPRLSYPMRLWDAVEVLPEIGYHGTLYQSRERSFDSRNLFTVQLDVRTRLRRALTLPFGVGQALHVIEPHVQYTGVTHASQDGNPLFTPQTTMLQQRLRELGLFSVTRDYADRIADVNAFTFGFGNRVYVPREEAEGTRLFADVDFALQYDFENDGFTGVYADGSLWPAERIRTRFNLGYDFNAGELSEGMLATSWSHEEGHDLGIAYRYVAQAPRFFEAFRFDDERFDEFQEGVTKINQIFLFARWAVTRNWALTYRMQYSFEQSFFLGNQGGVEYISKCRCWAIRASVSDERTRGVEFALRYRLIGLGEDTVRPFQSRGRRDRGERFEEEEL